MIPTPQDILTLARTIYGEARGEFVHPSGGLASLIAVANVILNRLAHTKKRFGQSIHEICLKPYQFSCWNLKDPNRRLILNMMKGSVPLFDLCYEVAERVACREWPDLTKGSNHYHAPMTPKPAWAKGHHPQIQIGQHAFYMLD